MSEKSTEEKMAEAQAAAQVVAEKYHCEATVNALDAEGNVLASFTGVCRCPDCSDERIDALETRVAE
ncbi:MAG: hypothetical protein WC054_12070 [Candidatus Nanopelagicales bacterium]